MSWYILTSYLVVLCGLVISLDVRLNDDRVLSFQEENLEGYLPHQLRSFALDTCLASNITNVECANAIVRELELSRGTTCIDHFPYINAQIVMCLPSKADIRSVVTETLAANGMENIIETIIRTVTADQDRVDAFGLITDKMTGRRFLEIGPGKNGGVDGPAVFQPKNEALVPWTTVDALPYPGMPDHHIGKLGYERLPFHDSSFDIIFASHILEHVPWHHTHEALLDIKRLLKPGGRLEVWVPDLEKMVSAYLSGNTALDGWYRYNPRRDPTVWLNGRMFTYGPEEANYHRAAFDERHLFNCLREAGFINETRLNLPRGGHHHGWVSLGVGASKPATADASSVASTDTANDMQEQPLLQHKPWQLSSDVGNLPIIVAKTTVAATPGLPVQNAAISTRRPDAKGHVNWVSIEEVAADVRYVRGSLPARISQVVGVPRSGMLAATQLALHVNAPLKTLEEFLALLVLRGSDAVRRSPRSKLGDAEAEYQAGGMYSQWCQQKSHLYGNIVIVDDSISTGGTLASVRNRIESAVQQAHTGRVLDVQCIMFHFVALYDAGVPSNRQHPQTPPYTAARIVPHDRTFEWNFLHRPFYTARTIVDIDGVLCLDPTREQNDDGPKYLNFIEHARPLYLPTTYPVYALVTARLEKYRNATEHWLAKHGVLYQRLIMMPYATAAERRRRSGNHGFWKAQQWQLLIDAAFAEYGDESYMPQLFVESADYQAEAIVATVQRPVLSIESMRIFNP